jgi:cytidylate kinase
MQQIIIAIDGHSSTGKSTLARQLANKLGYLYIDSGAMYRAVTLFALENGLVKEGVLDARALIRSLSDLQLHLGEEGGIPTLYMNGRNVEREIRSMEVSEQVSVVAAIPQVRQKLVTLQRLAGAGRGVVMDGRDIGTVVFPHAELKLFLTAPLEIRAQRRYKELVAKGIAIQYEEVLKNIEERDYIDSHRERSPLVQAPDAVVLDNGNLGVEEQLVWAYSLALQAIKKSGNI